MAVVEKNSSKRMFGVALGIFLMAATIAVKLTNIQWNEGDYYKKLAKDRTVKTFVIPANKGNIYSADGELLATTVPYFDVYVDFGSNAMTDELFKANIDSLAYYFSKTKKDKYIHR